ncbi:MFS transporter [Saccharolobus caldissimus]|uniref:Sugar transporter n=1 Tax=Saccharolobus caldissimus TaxID=1702097 RepID=A0AAQ4CUF2_9CREN|nr:MFS transporter [Saccharolobus caldissimus]BDB99433.1 sugar transporter [Saccharolobus caldissimus]
MEIYKKYLIAVFIGVLLMTMDFELFLAAIPGLIPLFKFSLAEITIITDISFLTAAIASFAFGYLADRIGRRPLFMLTTLLYSLGSFFTALANSLVYFILARSVTSLGTGPDEPLGFTIIAEVSPARMRGLMLAIVSIAFPLGQAIGALLVYTFVVNKIYLPYVFFIGVLPALFLLYLRKGLPETERFKDLKSALDNIRKGSSNISLKYKADINKAILNPFYQMFNRDLRKKSIIFAIYTIIVAGSVAVTLIDLPIYYTTIKHITFVNTLAYEFISFAIAAIGYILASIIGNRISRRNVLIIWNILAFIALLGIIFSSDPLEVLAFNILFVFFLFSQWAAWPFYINEMYPTRVRATASTFGYGFQWLGNILLPTFISIMLSATNSWINSIIAIVAFPLILMSAIVSLLPRDNPKAELEENAI